MPSVRLTYFTSAGRAEPVRLVLTLGGVPFEDRRLTFPEFMAMRQEGAFPLGALPTLEVDGLMLTQTAAMLRYADRLGGTGLYPADPLEALIVDSVLDTYNDTLSNALLPSLFERDPEKKLAMRRELAAGPLARVLAYTEGLLRRSGGPYLLGDRLSLGDILIALQVGQIQRGVLDGLGPEVLEPHPHVVALTAAFASDERLAAWRNR